MARKKKTATAKAKPKTAKTTTTKTATLKTATVKAKAKQPKASAPASRSANNRPRTAATAQYYFPSSDFDPRITDRKPRDVPGVLEGGSFDEIKEQSIDALIEIIDRCEERLWQLKRANSFNEYEQLGHAKRAAM